MRWLGLSPSATTPSTMTVPACGFTMPVIALNMVLLPEPFGPITEMMRPGSSVSEASTKAVMPPKRTVTSRISMLMSRSSAGVDGRRDGEA